MSKETFYRGNRGLLRSKRGLKLLGIPVVCVSIKRDLEVDLIRSKRDLLTLAYLSAESCIHVKKRPST
jgi:hypothetical protein